MRVDALSLPQAGATPPGLIKRIFLLALFFTIELVSISIVFDGDTLAHATGLTGIIRSAGAWILRGVVGFVAIFATFTYLKKTPVATALAPLQWRFFAVHACAIAIFIRLSSILYAGSGSDLLAASWFAAGISAIVFAAFAFLPWSLWLQLIRGAGSLWAYALAAVVAGCSAGSLFRLLWMPASHLTFDLVRLMLSPLLPGLFANPATMSVGTNRFYAIISPECSGLEGAGLILAFGVLWLVLFRHECRFPHALLLLPAGVVLIFLLNAVRLAALVLIGNAGARQIAAGGFHSQAGWILFNAVAVGFCVIVRRVTWFAAESYPTVGAAENPAAAYLMPFLAILAAGMIAVAASAKFEWLYPLRFLAAAAMLWRYRRSYSGLIWRFGWFALLTGGAVFLVWIVLDRFLNPAMSDAVPSALAAASLPVRATWVAFRLLAAVITVPIAEELAFRGFLMRRLIAPDVDAVPFPRVTVLALSISSVAFGVLHAGHIIAGIVAGVLFGLAAMRQGRIGDAVAAHAAANAFIAGYVLIFGAWHLW